MSNTKSLAKAASVIMVATLVGRFVGFIREMVIANQFGASVHTDAYVVAYTIPSMVAMALAGAFNAAFLPVFNDYLVSRDRGEANNLANTTINLVAVFFITLITAAFVLSPYIVKLLAPGFDRASLALTAKLFRIILPALLFIGLMGLISAILNSYRHFLFPALGPMITSLVTIGFVLALGRRWGIASLAAGTMVGFAAQFLFQLPVMWKKGFQYRLIISWSHPGVKKTLWLMLPVVLGVIIGQAPVFVERGLASTLEAGSISALNYANRVMQLPLGLFVAAISIPVFPALSVYASKREYGQLKETLIRGISLFFLILVPAAVGLLTLNKPIIKLLFEHGEFTVHNTVVTANALAYYALAIIPWALRDILTRSFYALQDTVTPVLIAAVGAMATVLFDLLLVKIMGVGGLALGLALGLSANVLLLYVYLRRKLGKIFPAHWLLTLGKIISAGAVMALVTAMLYNLLGSYVPDSSRQGLLLKILLAGAAGVLVYFFGLLLLKVREIADLTGLIIKLKDKMLKSR
ncbi:murein biosynthesis integral membrane protein MurJ [Thermincola potens]|uniref:Probable lipid II flippase MurJ n=1 Tax=Thermincola potens (strain JR) TaxID=635013 RepID=D5XCX9_THEPJ|nr:murein biosynthesis integral membrane protein MurJ [Thermincola potens]ADG83655.1 integral membrane protein MviN [Thermincola potens JR]